MCWIEKWLAPLWRHNVRCHHAKFGEIDQRAQAIWETMVFVCNSVRLRVRRDILWTRIASRFTGADPRFYSSRVIVPRRRSRRGGAKGAESRRHRCRGDGAGEGVSPSPVRVGSGDCWVFVWNKLIFVRFWQRHIRNFSANSVPLFKRNSRRIRLPSPVGFVPLPRIFFEFFLALLTEVCL